MLLLFPVLAAGFPEAQTKVEARDLKKDINKCYRYIRKTNCRMWNTTSKMEKDKGEFTYDVRFLDR